MFAKRLIRSVHSRLNAAVIWAMVPVAALSGQSVSGCLSANGQFDPNCHCWAKTSQAVGSCHCHCACCGTAYCCCKNKSSACNAMAKHTSRPGGESVQSSGHCRPYAMFLAITAVHGSQHVAVERPTVNALAPLTTDVGICVSYSSGQPITEVATGLPPDNLVVELHRWVI